MNVITDEIKVELKDMIYDFFADECEVDIKDLKPETNIIEELDGDSLMVIELIENVKKKYSLELKLQTIGKYMLKNSVETLSEIVNLFNLIYQYGDDIINVEVCGA
ncbi:MAG: acyl carrier protein [Oscillospiraceae bacterium]|nr:acyl carrier protein [Oscillospiraceae bacterium]